MSVKTHTITIFFIFAVSSFAGCATNLDYVTGNPTFNTKSIEEDVELGTRYATLLLASAEARGISINPDDEHTKIIKSVTAKIMSIPENRARMPPFPWSLNVIRMKEPNAWCFSGGQMLVFSGLLESGVVKNEDEVAMIIGHEIAHAAARHATERSSLERLRDLTKPFGTFFGPKLISLRTNVNISDINKVLSRTEFQFDHVNELEADLIGLELMSRAGYSPQRGIEMWRRLSETPAEELNIPVNKTHPPFDKRLSELQNHLPAISWLVKHRTSTTAPTLIHDTWNWNHREAEKPASKPIEKRTSEREYRVFPLFMKAPEHLLSLTLKVTADKSRDRRSFTTRVEMATDFVEARLPLHISSTLERLHPTSQTLVESRTLKSNYSVDAHVLEFRSLSPRLFRGEYRLTVSAVIGSLKSQQSVLIQVE